MKLTVKTKHYDIDAYIAACPEEVRSILEQIRSAIHQAVPEAEEAIKYDMPAFMYKGILVSFGAFKHHIGFYPAPAGDAAFEKRLMPYKTGKGSVRFPLDRPMPIDLITELVHVQVKRNTLKEEEKRLLRKK